jgi:hypothetical protein
MAEYPSINTEQLPVGDTMRDVTVKLNSFFVDIPWQPNVQYYADLPIVGSQTGHLRCTVGKVYATYSTSFAAANSNLEFTAKTVGVTGNWISIEFIDVDAETSALSISVENEYRIIVNLEQSANSPVSTATEIKTAIENNATANALVSVEFPGSEDGTGICEAFSRTYLSDGASAGSIWRFTGSTWILLASRGNVEELIDARGDFPALGMRLDIALQDNGYLTDDIVVERNIDADQVRGYHILAGEIVNSHITGDIDFDKIELTAHIADHAARYEASGAIEAHHHTGGAGEPSQIDLTSEVTGQLPQVNMDLTGLEDADSVEGYTAVDLDMSRAVITQSANLTPAAGTPPDVFIAKIEDQVSFVDVLQYYFFKTNSAGASDGMQSLRFYIRAKKTGAATPYIRVVVNGVNLTPDIAVTDTSFTLYTFDRSLSAIPNGYRGITIQGLTGGVGTDLEIQSITCFVIT